MSIERRGNIERIVKELPGILDNIANEVAIYFEKEVLDTIDSQDGGRWPPLHPFTIERKGSSQPLKDKGELYNSITHKIEHKGSVRIIKVGLFGEIAKIGAVHEFGAEIEVTPKMRAFLHSQGLHLRQSTIKIIIPERSFLRSTLSKKERTIKDMLRGRLKQELQKYGI